MARKKTKNTKAGGNFNLILKTLKSKNTTFGNDMKLVFATNNPSKIKEVAAMLPPQIQLLSLADIGCHENIPETGSTLQENAEIKADHILNNYGFDCFADDTGLLVDALNGAPGVFSARYAGEHCTSEQNMEKLLEQLQDSNNRNAHFKTVIALHLKGEKYFFEGAVHGKISLSKSGTDGFGYDPLFKPEGYDQTFAEMPLTEKNKISHRSKALQKLIAFINTNQNEKK